MDKNFPKTLQDAIKYFANPNNCHVFMVELRWADGKVTCPHCGSDRVTFLEKENRFKCYEKHTKGVSQKFSLKTGTIFEDSPVGLDKWLAAMWMVVNCKNGISSYEIHRALGVTQKTAWFMDHRIRFALNQGSFMMGGEGGTVEADETFIGGLSRNMHKDRRAKTITGTGGAGKVAVFGLLERHGEGKSKVRAQVVPDRFKSTIQPIIKENVEPKSNVYTDEHLAYRNLAENDYFHAFVKHAEYYVDGAVHTNGIENFWSLLKRGIRGTYVSVEPFHMFRYLDEQVFRFNERFGNDQERFLAAMAGVVDRRLTYKVLTGKQEGASPEANA
jgi:transposase-like protein